MTEGKRFFAIRGYMKSGTNWIGRLLNLHPQISCKGEFHWERISAQLIETFNESENLREQSGLMDHVWQRLDRFIKESMVLACDDDAMWIGDRTPSHIEPSVITGARVFNLTRDGRDVLVSAAFHFFNNPGYFPAFEAMDDMQKRIQLFQADSDYFRLNPKELLANHRFIRNIASHWAETVTRNRQVILQTPDLVSMEVQYEDVHQDAELMRNKMYEFLEVDPDLAAPLGYNTIAGFESERPTEFLRKGAVGDWKDYFTPMVKSVFDEIAGEAMNELGYTVSRNWETFLNADGPNASQETTTPASDSVGRRQSSDQLDSNAVAETVSRMSKARALLAYGGLDGVVQRPLFDLDGGVFPHFAKQAQGCRIVDTVGRSYIDWLNGWGPVMIGYNRPEVNEAIRKQMDAGPTLSLMHPVEIEVAELLVSMIPCAEMVAFGKNGSDAVNASLRIARAVTGRRMILQCGFHGFHEWYTCLHPEVQGMPAGLREQVEPFPYNDLAALEELLEKHNDQVAAVIMEPVNLKIPDQGYLDGVRELTQQHGCLLIFDEMVTAFRLANGGAQEYFGVTPDLACIGKGMANGMPLSAVVGKRAWMQTLPACGFGLTFRGETYSLAAAKSVLELLIREPVCEHLAAVGRAVRERFGQLAIKTGVQCGLVGPDARMTFEFYDCATLDPKSVRTLFLQECLKNGIITNGTLFPSYAHDDLAINESMAAFENALIVVATAIRAGQIDESRPHGGSPMGPRAFISTGFLEHMACDGDLLDVHGWMLLEDGAPDSIEFVSAVGDVIPARSVLRPDLESGFPQQPTAKNAGYAASVPLSTFKNANNIEFTIVARRSGQTAFRCLVVVQNPQSEFPKDGGPYATNDGVLYI